MLKFSTWGGAALLSAALLVLPGCGEDKAASAAAAGAAAAAADGAATKLRIGVCPGPYGLMVEKAIAPALEQEGYRVTVVDFTDYVQPNLALESGDLDANLMQHRAYLDNLVATQGAQIEAVTNVPTLGMGVFSDKVKDLSPESLEAIRGGQVGVPNDAVNLARSLRLAQELGLVLLSALKDENQASIADIEQNPLGLEFVPMEAAQIARSLDSLALGFVPGNYAYAAQLDYAQALGVEQVAEDIKNVIAVPRGDEAMKALFLRVIHAPAFKQAIESDSGFDAFTRPLWWNKVAAESAGASAAESSAASSAAAAPEAQ